jgi:GT2 family glycosyltransferase
MRSLLEEPDKFDFTISVVAYNNLTATRQTIDSLLYYSTRTKQKVEVIVANLSSDPQLNQYLEGQLVHHHNFRVIYANPERFLGEGAGRNLALRQGRGKYLLLLDSGLVLQNDLFEPLFNILQAANRPGLYGLYPLEIKRQDAKIVGSVPLTIKNSKPDQTLLEVEALEGAFLCFQRNLVDKVGFLDERFRYPFSLDLDYSFAFHDKELPVLALPTIANAKLVQRTTPTQQRPTYGLTPTDIEHQSQKNWQLFLKSWNLG